MRQILNIVRLDDLPERAGGFDVKPDWADVLSLCEQQRLAFARLLVNCPGYAVLDEATGALDVVNEPTSIDMAGIRYISVGHRRNTLAFHDRVLELQATDQWRLLPVAAHREALDNG